MGTYFYSLAKRNINATLPSGEEVTVFNFPYRFKPGGSWRSEQAQEKVMQVHERTAKNVIESNPRWSGYVSLDASDGFRYSYVYKLNDEAWSWYDSNPFPGKLVGFLDKYEKRWIVRNQGIIPSTSNGTTSVIHERGWRTLGGRTIDNTFLMLPVKSETEFYGPPPEIPQWTPSARWPYAQARSHRTFPQPEFLNGFKAKLVTMSIQLTPIFYDTGEFVVEESDVEDRWRPHFEAALDDLEHRTIQLGEEIIL